MITDNTGWIHSLIRNKAFFARQIFEGRVYLLAANRAARRMLRSTKIKNLAKKNGVSIEDNTLT